MIAYETALRLAAFAATLALLLLAERLLPRRVATVPRLPRWRANLLMVVVSSLLVRIALPVAAVGWATAVAARDWGLFQQFAAPAWLEGIAAFVLLDLAVFLQHWATHYVPWLWRLHRVHHSDLDFDASTGVRFHPVEILLSMLWKMAVITVIGPAAIAVLVFEIALSSSSLWEHANLRLPTRLDRLLRWLIVTPDMHRVHHSWYGEETNSNYGFNLSWWDYLFRTYRAQPRDGHERMTIGLKQFRDPRGHALLALLLQPMKRG